MSGSTSGSKSEPKSEPGKLEKIGIATSKSLCVPFFLILADYSLNRYAVWRGRKPLQRKADAYSASTLMALTAAFTAGTHISEAALANFTGNHTAGNNAAKAQRLFRPFYTFNLMSLGQLITNRWGTTMRASDMAVILYAWFVKDAFCAVGTTALSETSLRYLHGQDDVFNKKYVAYAARVSLPLKLILGSLVTGAAAYQAAGTEKTVGGDFYEFLLAALHAINVQVQGAYQSVLAAKMDEDMALKHIVERIFEGIHNTLSHTYFMYMSRLLETQTNGESLPPAARLMLRSVLSLLHSTYIKTMFRSLNIDKKLVNFQGAVTELLTELLQLFRSWVRADVRTNAGNEARS